MLFKRPHISQGKISWPQKDMGAKDNIQVIKKIMKIMKLPIEIYKKEREESF